VSDDQARTEIKYTQRVLGYVDVLGWRDLIRKSAQDFSVMATVDKAVKALTLARENVTLLKGIDDEFAPEMTVFSDTLVVSGPVDAVSIELLVGQVQMFALSLMAKGLYTRGAIVQGPLHHKDGVILGPALVEAYELESSAAKYPRILIPDTGLATAILALPRSGFPPHRSVLEDFDGMPVLNVFGGILPGDAPAINVIRDRVSKDLLDHRADAGIRAKLGWLRKFIDRVVAESTTQSTPDTAGDG
jgi:hypothetical protein